MTHRRTLITVLLIAAAGFGGSAAHAQAREEAKIIVATQVMEELRAQKDQYLPDLLLERAYGIAIVPDVVKVGFGIAGRRGTGVLLVRDSSGRFSQPVFIALTGGSVGWQIGAQKTDVVLVFTTRKGIEGITDGKLTLGADASVAAGPVGRSASAATDQSFSAEIYSYSRSRGLFAGVALDGTALTVDSRANSRFYGRRDVSASEVINGNVTRNSESVRRLLAAIATSTRTAPAAHVTGSASASAGAPPAPSEPVTPARTFPLDDAPPAAEPRPQP
ncbi:MAG: lipid-binding SYLF domain-containing protein [Steroidobacteraceae bacterium]|nr:lipid-binding SYLF domain-containing protein [Steroidobacteraceae bacterium]MDW8257846.1 lipid-binding SYLF domain-containing protein [Gammaproteobacteria bacterium]